MFSRSNCFFTRSSEAHVDFWILEITFALQLLLAWPLQELYLPETKRRAQKASNTACCNWEYSFPGIHNPHNFLKTVQLRAHLQWPFWVLHNFWQHSFTLHWSACIVLIRQSNCPNKLHYKCFIFLIGQILIRTMFPVEMMWHWLWVQNPLPELALSIVSNIQ